MSKLELPKPPVVTVNQIADYFDRLLDKQSALKNLIVRGELTDVSLKAGAYLYFTMKEGTSVLHGAMFQPFINKLDFIPKPGDKVDITGAIKNYSAKGQYQLRASAIEITGKGQYYLELEKLKKKLRAEGFFDEDRKKAIPPYCKKVGIITTDTGKGIDDIVVNARKRNPYVQLIFIPSRVEGKDAPEQIVRALYAMDLCNVDCIILGRGGGGPDTLYTFNDERVIRAVFECNTPLISAVGHEGDWTLTDLVADFRVSTPTAAAVKAVFNLEDALNRLDREAVILGNLMEHSIENRLLLVEGYENRIKACPIRILNNYQLLLQRYEGRLVKKNPEYVVRQQRIKLDNFEFKLKKDIESTLDYHNKFIDNAMVSLPKTMDKIINSANTRFQMLVTRLDAKSPLKRLTGGYGYITKEDKPLLSAGAIDKGDEIEIVLSDGRASCTVNEIKEV